MFDISIAVNWRRLIGWSLAIAVLMIVALYGGRAIFADTKTPVRLVVYAFSTQEELLSQRILPAFEQSWEAETGRDLIIEGLFGPSGTLAGQINLGAPADVALFSNEQHVTWLKVGRRVAWDTKPVVVGWTPMVIVTRPGNPAGIATWSDLAKPDLCLLHANPRQSGAGEWAVLAEYGSAFVETGDRSVAEAQLKAIWRNVCLLGPSARASLTLFELGAGDALVTYEQDARLALARGVPLEIVVPSDTVLAQHVAVIVDDNVTRPERAAAQAFIEYLLSQAGQQALVDYYLRPVALESSAFPDLTTPFTAAELGGWPQLYPELVERLWQAEIEPRLRLEPVFQLD